MNKKTPKNIFYQHAIPAEFISDNIKKHQSKTDIGAHSIFLGQVRADELDSKTVTGIRYTAFEAMALEKMHDIREETITKYDLTCMHVYHSLGYVPAGEICLFVFTSSRHRKDAMHACEEVVERIKSELPVWGEEIYEDGSQTWKINT